MTEVLHRVQLENLRTTMLLLLEQAYPAAIRANALRAALKQHDYELTQRAFDAEIAYLEEKALLRSTRNGRGSVTLRITARGRDFLDGYVEEIGLGDPSMLRQRT
ncbi:MAG: hypothetical protein ACM3PW_09765 [Chlamydiota bacterium]